MSEISPKILLWQMDSFHPIFGQIIIPYTLQSALFFQILQLKFTGVKFWANLTFFAQFWPKLMQVYILRLLQGTKGTIGYKKVKFAPKSFFCVCQVGNVFLLAPQNYGVRKYSNDLYWWEFKVLVTIPWTSLISCTGLFMVILLFLPFLISSQSF